MLTRGDLVALCAMQVLGVLFWWYQNRRPDRLGGGISLVKSLWLVYAISLWIVAPFLVWRSAPALRTGAAVLAASMTLRSVAEAYLCLVTRTWRVRYGVGHDVFHVVVCVAVATLLWRSSLPGLLLVGLTTVSLLTELLFVSWFHRATGGPATGAFFVPGGPRYATINRRSLLIFGPQYALAVGLALCAAAGGAAP